MVVFSLVDANFLTLEIAVTQFTRHLDECAECRDELECCAAERSAWQGASDLLGNSLRRSVTIIENAKRQPLGDQVLLPINKVKPSGKRQYQTRWLDGESFTRAFAQHILPPGFQKIRYYGFMSPNCKLQLADVRWLVWLWRGWTFWLGSAMFQEPQRTPEPPKCPRCGGDLELIGVTDSEGHWLWRRPVSERGPPENVPNDFAERSDQVTS